MKAEQIAAAGIFVTLFGASCGSRDNGPVEISAERGESTATVAEAIIPSGAAVESDSTHWFTEATAATFVNSSGVNEILVSSIANTTILSTQDPNHYVYSCSNDGGNTWNTYSLGMPNYVNNDVSSVGVTDPSTFGYYAAFLLRNEFDTSGLKLGYGIGIVKMTEPCPTNGNFSWSWSYFTLDPTNHGIDYPHIYYNANDNNLYLSWIRVDTTLQQHINVGRLNTGGKITGMTSVEQACSSPPLQPGGVNAVIQAPAGGFVMQLVYDTSDGKVIHDSFNPTTLAFACTQDLIATWTRASGSCSQCQGVPTYGDLSSCAKQTVLPFIGTDVSTKQSLVVTYSTPGGGTCSDASETRWYRSVDEGTSWSLSSVTGCQNSLQPTIVYDPSVPQRWHTMSSWAPHGSGQALSQADWQSTDDGISWGGTLFTGARAPFDTNQVNCAWGDYNASVVTNQGIFHAWGQQDATTPMVRGHWKIRGAFVAP